MPFRPQVDGEIPSLGQQLGEHIEHYLGIELTSEQAHRLIRLYQIDPVNGRRIVRRAGLRRPKGAGKSPEGGYIGFGELTGPVMFDGWNAEGRPVGRAMSGRDAASGPWIQFAAVSEDQTDNVLVWLYEVLGDRADQVAELGVDLGRTRIYLKGRPGRIEPVTAAAGSREGQPITFAVLDQTEAWKKENGGVRLAATLRRNVAKTDGWTYELQNAPAPADGSVADMTSRAWSRGQAGVLFDTVEPSKIPDLDDRPALVASLAEVYGEAVDREWVSLDRLAEECVDADTSPSDAYRFYLNVSMPSEEAAFDIELWHTLQSDFKVPDGALVTLGFDGARFRDTTALVGTHVVSGFQWVVGLWERPPNAPPDWEIDESDVDRTVSEAFESWNVWRLYADPPYWETWVDVWAGRWENRVVRYWTNRTKPMAYSLKAFSTAMRSKEISHDGDPRLAEHVKNARRKETPQARDEEGRPLWTIRKDAPDSPLKIDAAMAAVLSWEARGDAIAAGATEKKISVYEERGMQFA
jgi:hypothetical protein